MLEVIDDNTNKPNDKRWKANHAKIKQYVLETLDKSKGTEIPSILSISEATGINQNTVRKHFQGLKFEPLLHPMRVLTDNVIYNIYKCSKTNSAAQELWLMLMEGWSRTVNIKLQEIPPIIFKRADETSEENPGS